MYLWRISNHFNLDGAGGIYAGGRWHTQGHPIVYCTLNSSTSLLEMLVHFNVDSDRPPRHLHILKIEVPDACSVEIVKTLPGDWVNNPASTQRLGDLWLTQRRSLLLEVPNAIVPETWNVLINPLHSEANLLKIVANYEHALDPRLLR
ncbi:MAG TPA: RES family NAD+ phosphorylase [Acidisarcina sp.]